jgi:glycosyltransferase involved in cell wall biosynthesis
MTPMADGKAAPDTSAARPLFSIVIPVRNDEVNLVRCLASLQRLDSSGPDFEVIVVDNGSTDATLDAAREFQKDLPLAILERPGVYISAVRNAGAARARGECLVFLDSDCEVRRDWLQQAACAISGACQGVFGSGYLIPEGSSWVARHWYDEREKKCAGEVSYLPSGDLFVKREFFRDLRGFDEVIQTNEDYEFCQRARTAGSTITCVPELAVIHWGTPQSVAGFFRKNRWHGMHVFRVFLRNLPSLYNFKAVALAVYTMFCLLLVLAGVVAAIKSRDLLLLGGSLAALLLPPLLMGLKVAISSRRPHHAPAMAFLYFVYAIARAGSLADWRNWTVHRAN